MAERGENPGINEWNWVASNVPFALHSGTAAWGCSAYHPTPLAVTTVSCGAAGSSYKALLYQRLVPLGERASSTPSLMGRRDVSVMPGTVSATDD